MRNDEITGPDIVFPDEDTFVMPDAWRELAHPRRDGVRRKAPDPHPEGAQQVAQRLRETADRVEQLLAAPDSEPRIVEAVRAQQHGTPDPLGAAVLAAVAVSFQVHKGAFVDAWAAAHGIPFAARAVVEYVAIKSNSTESTGYSGSALRFRAASYDRVDEWYARPHFADRVRELLADTDDETYRRTVAALADRRTDERTRITVSYLLPTEHDWSTECTTGPLTADQQLRAMLLASLHSPAQLGHFGDQVRLSWDGWRLPLVASLAHSTGAACAPLLRPLIEYDYEGDFAGALVELPSDDAFGILLAHAGLKHVRPELLTAMRRYPVRALRLVGAAACGTGKAAPNARYLLAGHVRAHRELAAAVLPDLPAEVAARVEPLLTGAGRVAEAPAEALPALLVSPPWTTKRKTRKARVATGVTPPEPRVAWAAGEREEWAGTYDGYRSGRRNWSKEIETLRKGGPLPDVRDARLFVDSREDVVRPLLADWNPEVWWDGERRLRPVAARHGVHAVPVLLRGTARRPAIMGPLLLPYLHVDVAGRLCDWLTRLKTVRVLARDWLSRHGLAAVPFLVPHAVGPVGRERGGAGQALRLLAAEHGAETVLEYAAECGPEAADIVAEALAADPLESGLPARVPTVGDWADPELLPQILLTQGGALPVDATGHVLTMLALSRPGEAYPGIEVLIEHCTADSLAAFAWGVFEQWRFSGMPAKESWALHALAWFGDDETVRRLTPVLRAWPGENAHRRAVEGLDVLATIGSDLALTHLHSISQRVPFKALKVRAEEKISEVAEGLGLTREQLGDRLVPDFGLDADGSTVIDYGARRFTVGFDEQLQPYVRDADGKLRKALPAPGAKDDAELAPAERKRFAALKKDVRTVAGDQVRRLEAAMVAQRDWPAAEFRALFVAHPLLWHLVRRLVWLRELDGEVTAFRVAEDRTFADVHDDELALPERARVRLAHPLHLGDQVGAWAELFADYEILQPFPQLGRAVHALTEDEAAGHRLTRFEDTLVPIGKLLGLTKRGWERGAPQDAGIERWFFRRIDDDHCLVLDLDPGIVVGIPDQLGDQTFRAVWLDSAPGDYYPKHKHPLRLGGVDPVLVSELLADLTAVTTP
ncbi:DUF4132 domain-containing protein [Streptomyces sp. NPDC057877]|uniref:DUF4132 domain-containing protein n=1 Tax=Streptomyces sp. NPDC057877 TaxID=3346269 RepID=UPI0036769EA0